ncbi:MAG: TonB-dependent receptor plug domain-containing protein [Bacteroidales bacterium]|nr:TonB-dependent receptor plug domain-containing protein [Bacteroidales bacterium]
MKSANIKLILSCVMLFPFLPCHSQEIRDSLNAAIKIDSRKVMRGPGKLQTRLEGMRSIITPLGEGDPIHWAQAMPGVTTGADGSSAFYVRGGNMGNNLFTLDGVPVYGYSHLLGLTTIIPHDAIDKVQLSSGGFKGGDNNFTAAHLSITTKDPSKEWHTRLSLNNFIITASGEGMVSDKLSTFISARISPLALEYRAVSGMLSDKIGDLDDFSAGVGDIYGKVVWRNGYHSLRASFLGSMDNYGFKMSENSRETMGWNNLIGSVNYNVHKDESTWNTLISANRYESRQLQDKNYRNSSDHLSLKSTLNEFTLSSDLSRKTNTGLTLHGGVTARFAQFAPGQVASVTNRSNTLLATLWGELDYPAAEKVTVQASIRGNYYRNLTRKSGRFDPEFSLSAEWNLSEAVSLRGTVDRMVQYYHTLEGFPVGWSLDMIVPSGPTVLPEEAWQAGTNLSFEKERHSASIGGFYKMQSNLVYYKYAQDLFDGALAAWEDHVDMGKGTSFGAEFLYEYTSRDLYARVAYTLSKTTRDDFKIINNGEAFHAKFDRRHVLNVNAEWKKFSAAFILQSGHWENGVAQTYTMHVPGATWESEYYDGLNNFHMPTLIRLDLGYRFTFETGKAHHDIKVGICNVTNHFNPFMLFFDSDTESWKEIALLPIMPNLNWIVSF